MTYYVFTDDQLQEALAELVQEQGADGVYAAEVAVDLITNFMHSDILQRRGMRKEPDL